MKKGKFVVFEGGDGCGKNTQIDLLKPFLPSDTVYTREPGGTEIGEKIRSILMAHTSIRMTPETEILLFYAARAQFLKELVGPALEEGKTVISSRFSPSTVAYQIYRKERLDLLPFLKQMEDWVVEEKYRPDICLIFNLPAELALERAKERRNHEVTRFDIEPLDSYERVEKGYIKSVKDLGYKNFIINAAPFPEVVHKEVLKVLEDVLSLKKPAY